MQANIIFLICTLSLGSLSASVMPAEYHLERMTDKQKEFLTKNADEVIKRYPAGDIMHEMAKVVRNQNRVHRAIPIVRNQAQQVANRELFAALLQADENRRRAEVRRRFIPQIVNDALEHPRLWVLVAGVIWGGATAAVLNYFGYPLY